MAADVVEEDDVGAAFSRGDGEHAVMARTLIIIKKACGGIREQLFDLGDEMILCQIKEENFSRCRRSCAGINPRHRAEIFLQVCCATFGFALTLLIALLPSPVQNH